MATKDTRFNCSNPECPWMDHVRVIPWRPVGPGLWERPGPLYCECDYQIVVNELPDLEQ